jgi:transcriptional regulator with XRE-family HTH domain
MSIAGKNIDPNASVGDRIRVWRNHFGLTQIQLEQRAGLAHNAVSRIEKREVSPRLETVESLASAMGLSVEQLQFGQPPRSRTRVNRSRTNERDQDIIIQRLASLSPDKAEGALELIHRFLDLIG